MNLTTTLDISQLSLAVPSKTDPKEDSIEVKSS